MYLKAIKAHGFKSFADKTLIELSNNISGIVGPNGSGKSNVVDAVRWVLGEQSVKSLRGDGAMTDVIFQGSNSRPPSNIASVTLVLDNKDHYFKIENDEVAIKRRMYKDSTCEYYINNDKVRLKDVLDLLIDSGIGKESFNIISQGKIEEILSNKPEDRRIIFEEASGVLKYKKRKIEALRKLDKTHENMNRINDIISELESNLEPLRVQSENAKIYNNLNEELKNIEIALITSDITRLNNEYQDSKNKIESINLEISKLISSSSLNEAKIEEYKKEILSLDNLYNKYQNDLVLKISELEQVNSRRKIIIERQKYNVSDAKLHDNLVLLKEHELDVKNIISNLKIKSSSINDDINALKEKIDKENNILNKIHENKAKLDEKLKNILRDENNLNIKIETLKYSIDNNSSLPFAVKKILENPKLRGIHDYLANLFEPDDEYKIAISTILSSSLTYVVTKDEICAKEAINYLKSNNLGRTTFLPLNVIKPKYIDSNTLDILNNCSGFINTADKLVKYKKDYENIILNQLGNVIVASDIDAANSIAKKINYKYRIVTKDGQIINVGGSLTGGSTNRKNIITEKYELEKLINEVNNVVKQKEEIEEKINEIDNLYKESEDKIYILNKDLSEKSNNYENILKDINIKDEQLRNITLEINGTNNILNKELSKEEEEVLNEYYGILKEKDELELLINNTSKKKKNINNELFEYELNAKKENSIVSEKNQTLKNLEISVNRLDVKLDNLLSNLSNVYSLSYEEAEKKYILDIDIDEARLKVNNLKSKIRSLGIVNLAAVEEFEKVNTRYEFLTSQRNDLCNAEGTLLNIIDEMDKVMIKNFKETFEVIKENFKITFKELFKGGKADLVLTDKDDILNTGIDIIACPPGKKLTTISLLSGGEKTFTAISLLFAILKSKPVPFCILDEVEAALDDVNVDSFGKYIQNLKEKTQFIIITHKKKTMEYADVLYGITMQESGVSKLVSVKLEELK